MTARQYHLLYSLGNDTIPCLADSLEQAIAEGQQRNGGPLGDLVRVSEAGFEVWPRDTVAELAEAEAGADELEEAARGKPLYNGAVLSPEECAAVLDQLDALLGRPHTVPSGDTFTSELWLGLELLDKLRLAAGDLYQVNDGR